MTIFSNQICKNALALKGVMIILNTENQIIQMYRSSALHLLDKLILRGKDRMLTRLINRLKSKI